MTITAGRIRAAVAAYYRYQRQCLIAFEAPVRGYGEELADIIVLEKRRLLEIEVKVSIADFHKDKTKLKHHFMSKGDNFYPVHLFYFAVPWELANQVSYECDQLYPYAGVLSVRDPAEGEYAWENAVSPTRRGKILNIEKAPVGVMARILIQQSGTLCRLARENEILKGKLAAMRDSTAEVSNERVHER